MISGLSACKLAELIQFTVEHMSLFKLEDQCIYIYNYPVMLELYHGKLFLQFDCATDIIRRGCGLNFILLTSMHAGNTSDHQAFTSV